MRKNEVIKELNNKIKTMKNIDGYSETYKVGVISGLKLAISTIIQFKRR